ncbi:hypothetical protein WICMUC_005515 [Wickerhamomyces mucosus]|uniref:TAP42-like protein n=1 Tax=Wickerhamomyces mucosus TaxID=1378264 RepID=A0A9P8P6H0_9ASCO|nr:hypothetical protein WICMUC_005515 [Wickerhamomyces mucosus]
MTDLQQRSLNQQDLKENSTNLTLKERYENDIKFFENIILNSSLRKDSEEYQTQLSIVIQKWLDLKQIISQRSIFSNNESLEDLNTNEIKYLSVEFYLAQLYNYLSIPSKSNNLKKSILLNLQFLTNLNNYDLLTKNDLNKLEKLKESPFEIINLYQSSELRRDEKISNYKLEKSLNLKLIQLSKLEDNENDYQNTDEEFIRSLYFDQLKLFTLNSFNNIRLITQELELLSNIPEPKIIPLSNDSRESSSINNSSDPTNFTDKLEIIPQNQPLLSKQGKILKPFTLLKRKDLQSKVFGTGQYLPTMTVEDYLEQELANGGMVSNSNQGEDQKESSDDEEDDYEKNDRETYKKREWDEFTDNNRKGSGNTMNLG